MKKNVFNFCKKQSQLILNLLLIVCVCVSVWPTEITVKNYFIHAIIFFHKKKSLKRHLNLLLKTRKSVELNNQKWVKCLDRIQLFYLILFYFFTALSYVLLLKSLSQKFNQFLGYMKDVFFVMFQLDCLSFVRN